MTSEVQLALIDLGKALVIAVSGGLVAWFKWRKEMRRLRKGFLVLADERRRDLWDRSKMLLDARYSTRYLTEGERELLARKDRIDLYRDAEWKEAGKPREALVQRKRYSNGDDTKDR